MRKKIINPRRVRRIEGGFSFIPHRFLTDGFLACLNQEELLLYFFLILASDRHGLSFYSDDAICSLLGLSADEYMEAREGLIQKDLVAFDGVLFQVLDLPSKPTYMLRPRLAPELDRKAGGCGGANLIQQSLWKKKC
jgi:hypothetical protein